MIGEWIRFTITALLMVLALVCFGAAVTGAWRFGFVMNRMHGAGIGDTLGLLCLISGLIVHAGLSMDSIKLLLLVFFMWWTSPVSSHFLIQIEYFTNPNLYELAKREGSGKKTSGKEE